jgi:hypothetical protein
MARALAGDGHGGGQSEGEMGTMHGNGSSTPSLMHHRTGREGCNSAKRTRTGPAR